MRTKFLRRAAIAMSLSAVALSGNASADQYYSSPSRWNNFRPALDQALAAEEADDLLGGMDDLPAPNLAPPQQRNPPQRNFSQPATPQPPMSSGVPPQGSGSRQQGSDSRQQGSGSRQQGSTSRHQGQNQQVDHGQNHWTPAPAPSPVHQSPAFGSPVASQPHYSGGYPPANYSPAPQSFGGQYPGNFAQPPATAPGVSYVGGADCQSCQNGFGQAHSSPSPYAQAVSSPWAGDTACVDGSCGADFAAGASRPPLFPWFGGASIIFFNLEEGVGRPVASNLDRPFTTSALDPGDNVGFDVSVGRYFGCGKYGLGVRFFQWNPGIERASSLGGDIRAAQPQYRDALIDLGGGDENVYDHIDGQTTATSTGDPTRDGAYRVDASRDLNFHGLELNLFSFGLSGAQRAAYAGCAPGYGHGLGGEIGHGRGFGGAAGPLARSNSGRVRFTTSHGIRYLRITDDTRISYGIDTTSDGINRDGRTTIFDDLDTENELLGYQFGGFLTYCLGKRLDLNIGGKFGVFGNRATLRQRLGTADRKAYLSASGVDDIDTKSSDTVLSTLGEFDLGLGYRVSHAWTIRGGYRVLGVTGVANAIDSRLVAFNNTRDLGQVQADDSYLLHGAYIGAHFNW